ncbi:MAG: HRDC domain-containing protein, partial [Chitinophagaceae bacterium]
QRLQLVTSVKEKKQAPSKKDDLIFIYPDLLTELKQLRDQLARKEHLPPDLIFTDLTLVELASYLPLTLPDLGKIPGFGNVKIGKYGGDFLGLIKWYCV